MKKIIGLLIVVTAMLCLTGCGLFHKAASIKDNNINCLKDNNE